MRINVNSKDLYIIKMLQRQMSQIKYLLTGQIKERLLKDSPTKAEIQNIDSVLLRAKNIYQNYKKLYDQKVQELTTKYIYSRNEVITEEMENLRLLCHSGKTELRYATPEDKQNNEKIFQEKSILITPGMVGNRLGDYFPTKKIAVFRSNNKTNTVQQKSQKKK